jgi:ABC-type branched-subunit amino acid transport system ATPase component/ABC-type branched-subunit amino acid transport system permease subunit
MRTSARSNALAGGAVIFSLLFAVPLVWGSDFRLQQFDYIIAVTMIAVGLNVVTGYAGQLALGPGGIFGIAGYAAAVLADHYPGTVGLFLMCCIGVAIASVAGVIVGVPALRVGGFYLGMATLAVALLVPVLGHQLSITGGDSGISLLALLDFAPNLTGVELYEVSVAVLFCITLWTYGLLHSRVGRRFLALANSEDLAASLGISGYRTKLLAFLLSAWPAGLGGAFYVYSQQFFTSTSADANLSIYVLAACVIGGFGSVMGPVVGGLVVFGLSTFLSSFQQWQGIIFGVLLAGFAILWPEGVMGTLERPGLGRPQPPWVGLLRSVSGHRTAVDHGERRPAGRARSGPVEAEPSRTVDAAEHAVTRSTGCLELRDVERSFGGVHAVAGASLQVGRGSIHALIGSNGSGKTTILNLISGFYRVDAGQIWLGDDRLDVLSAAEVARRGIGRTFQTPKLLLRDTLLANVLPAAESTIPCSGFSSVLRLPRGIRADRRAREIALQTVAQLGLDEYAHVPTSRLPHGLRRLGEIARCLAMSPSVLLLDEPAAGLTHAELERLAQVIRGAAERGVAVLLVEHNVPFVFQLATDITVLHLGRVIASGKPQEIMNDKQVAQAFLGSQAELVGSDPQTTVTAGGAAAAPPAEARQVPHG